jgi:hypothetical protein
VTAAVIRASDAICARKEAACGPPFLLDDRFTVIARSEATKQSGNRNARQLDLLRGPSSGGALR